MFMVGYAYQLGALPLSARVDRAAIELNGEAVAMNMAAFRWGRRAALDPDGGRGADRSPRRSATSDARRLSQSFDEMVARRVAFLTAYQNAAYARALSRWVEKAKAAEAAKAPGKTRPRRGGRALSVQADGLQGRVRGRAALQPTASFLSAGDERVRGRQPALRIPSRAAAVRAHATRSTGVAEAR